MNIRTALVTAGVLALPAVALAQPVDNVYVGVGAGFNILMPEKIIAPAGVSNFNTSTGFAGVVSVGYGFGNGFRVEGELSERYTNQSGSNGTSAKNNTFGAMVNGLYDIDVGADFVYPYVGVGVGYQGQSMSSGSLSNGTTFSGSNQGAFAAQAILGAAFPISDVPGLSLTTEYRYMGTFNNHTFTGVQIAPEGNNSFLFGVRYAFGVEPPPPPPAPAKVVAPAPAPARTYLVFFDWDKADLSARAKQIIGEAAANVARVQVTRIEVSGYADRTGTAAYNQKLSMKRAENVAAELVHLGVQKSLISVQAFGDTHPLVPTAEGVREPQNRRVEIVLK